MAQIKTLRKIGERMGWSPAKVLRRHKLDNFPLYLDWTKRELIWVTSDALIEEWERRKVQMNQGARLRPPPRPRHKPTYHPYNWRLRYKNETHSETIGPPCVPFEGEGEKAIREAVSVLPDPPVREEPVKLGPTNHELNSGTTQIGRYRAGAYRQRRATPTTHHPALTRKPMCTCGTLTICIAHD